MHFKGNAKNGSYKTALPEKDYLVPANREDCRGTSVLEPFYEVEQIMGLSSSNDGKKSYRLAAIIIGVVVLILLAATFLKALPCSFASLAGNDGYAISSVERMRADEAPVTRSVNADSDSYAELTRALNSEKLTYVRDEVGMSLDDTLYTLFLSGAESDMANFSFSSDGLVHDNEAEKTYKLSDQSIYGLCEQLFESSES